MKGYAPIKGSFNWTTEICTFIGFDFPQKIPNITQKCLIYDRIIRIYEDVKNDICEIIRIFAEKYFFYEIRIHSRKQQQTDSRKPTFRNWAVLPFGGNNRWRMDWGNGFRNTDI